MEEYYYITPENQRGGPVLPEQFAEKGITVETLVWTKGMEDWMPAGKIEAVKNFALPAMKAASSAATGRTEGTSGYCKSECSGMSYLPKPDNNMMWAILSTLCCCLPLGIVAIVKALEVNTLYYTGHYEQAVLKAESARNWAMWAAITGVAINIVYFLLTLSLPDVSGMALLDV